jgi:hypothetical protein
VKNQEFTLKSGAKLVVTPCEFEDSMNLLGEVKKATYGMPAETAMSTALMISIEVRRSFFRCAAKAAYEGRRVQPDLFNDEEIGQQARTDYFEIFDCVFKANCGDFFARASSASKGQPEMKA